MTTNDKKTPDDEISTDRLFSDLTEAALSPSPSTLSTLLSKPTYASFAQTNRTIPYNSVTLSLPITTILLNKSCSATTAANAATILNFCADHSIPHSRTITNDAVINSIGNTHPEASLAIFKTLLTAQPDAVRKDLEYLGDPLSYAIHNHHHDQKALVEYILDKGADPNNHVCAHTGPGHHIRLAARLSSLPIAKSLLQHGAVVKGSGAMAMAGGKGVVEMLELLERHGGDVQERGKDIRMCKAVNGKRGGVAEGESVLDVAVREGKIEAVEWLKAKGATSGGKSEEG